MPDHPIVHIEFASKDPMAAQKFYGDVFGWQVTTDDTFDYHMFQAPPGPAGAFVGASEGNESGGMRYAPGEVVVYIATDDIDATLGRIEANGGKTEMPRHEIPGVGWFAIFIDPQGTRAALFTAAPRQE